MYKNHLNFRKDICTKIFDFYKRFRSKNNLNILSDIYKAEPIPAKMNNWLSGDTGFWSEPLDIYTVLQCGL